MKKHNLFQKLKGHKKIISGMLVLTLCLGMAAAAGGIIQKKDPVKSSSNIPEHDGDILVDSIQVNDSSESSGKQETKDSELVTSDDVSDLDNSDTYFEEMRASINMDRNQVISMLTDAETSSKTNGEKENASQQKLKLLEYMELEQNTEHAIKAKGLPECLVLITDSGVNVTVNKQDLNQSDVTKIYDVVMRQTGRKAPEIVIQSKF